MMRNLAQHDIYCIYNSGPTVFAQKDPLLASTLKGIMTKQRILMGFSHSSPTL